MMQTGSLLENGHSRFGRFVAFRAVTVRDMAARSTRLSYLALAASQLVAGIRLGVAWSENENCTPQV